MRGAELGTRVEMQGRRQAKHLVAGPNRLALWQSLTASPKHHTTTARTPDQFTVPSISRAAGGQEVRRDATKDTTRVFKRALQEEANMSAGHRAAPAICARDTLDGSTESRASQRTPDGIC